MYSVVGCRECHALWIVEGRPETTRCPRCQRRHQFGSLRAFAETESSEAAARVRSSMLAERADDGEFVDPDEIDIENVGVDEVEFLAASGVDADAVAAAGERAEGGTKRSRSRKEVLLDSVAELEEPTREDIVAHATAAGIPESRVERALEKLHRNGEITRTDGVYREL
jgi:DNA replicative helicase MCM subunit Mcm2 (Cdc46/Mcm family)